MLSRREDLVVGDIVFVKKGDYIGADGCLVPGANACAVFETVLTGEDTPVPKEPGSFLFTGTEVADGETKMLVTAVGVCTVCGAIEWKVCGRANDLAPGMPWDGTPLPEEPQEEESAGCCVAM